MSMPGRGQLPVAFSGLSEPPAGSAKKRSSSLTSPLSSLRVEQADFLPSSRKAFGNAIDRSCCELLQLLKDVVGPSAVEQGNNDHQISPVQLGVATSAAEGVSASDP